MTPDPNFNLGRHEALIEQLVDGQRQLVADVSAIKDTLAEERGARRFKAGAWGIAGGAIMAVIATVFKAMLGIHA